MWRNLVLGAWILCAACGDAPTSQPPLPTPVASIELGASAESLLVGHSTLLSVVLKDSTGAVLTNRPLTWLSRDTSVVIVEGIYGSGSVVSKRSGRTWVIVTNEALHDSASIVSGYLFSSVAAGQGHTCGLLVHGELYCWGDNSRGQLADSQLGFKTSPSPVDSTRRYTTVSLGGAFTCGLTSTDGLYCWGSNELGQVGVGLSQTVVSTPVQVSGSYRSINAGQYHACAVATTGAAFCWGNNTVGELGIGVADFDRTAPVQVNGNIAFRDVSPGYGFTCGLAMSDSIYCWGDNRVGQLGDGTTTTRYVPAPIASSVAFKQVDAAAGYACGLSVGGELYCWGNMPDTLDQRDSIPFLAAPSLLFSSIDVSNDFACGVTTTAVAVCWGGNHYGNLGTGTSANSFTPTPIGTTGSFRYVVTGGLHACGLDLSDIIFCWGYNSTGQLGRGFSSQMDSVPRRVMDQP